MSKLTIYGFPQSTYVRTVLMVCAEKGVDYTLEAMDHKSEAYKAIHPFGKVPAMRHGDLVLFETDAITRYIDEAFTGPSLQPSDVAARARMTQWIGAINGYIYPTMIGKVVIERVAPKLLNRPTNEAVIKEAVPAVNYQLGLLDKALGSASWLAGANMSLADFFLLPIMFYMEMMPEGQNALPNCKNLGRWNTAMGERESVKSTVPSFN